MTKNARLRDSAVMMSSTTPSAKYSCSGSPLRFWNGRSAIEGFSGSASGGAAGRAGVDFESEVELVTHLVAHNSADTNAAWLGESLKPGRDVYPIAEDVPAADDDV